MRLVDTNKVEYYLDSIENRTKQIRAALQQPEEKVKGSWAWKKLNEEIQSLYNMGHSKFLCDISHDALVNLADTKGRYLIKVDNAYKYVNTDFGAVKLSANDGVNQLHVYGRKEVV